MARIGHLLILLCSLIFYATFVEAVANNSWCVPTLKVKIKNVSKKVKYSRFKTDGQLLTNTTTSEQFQIHGVKSYTINWAN